MQDAFVRLLSERSYASITIREIVMVAGTGLGSFYEYFASKEDLARVCLHLRSKALLQTMEYTTASHAGQPLHAMVKALVAAQMLAHQDRPQDWREHYLLERHLSGAQAYRKMYQRFVNAWSHALASASDLPDGYPLQATALTCHTLMYGLISHAHLASSQEPACLASLSDLLHHALLANVHALPVAALADPAVTAPEAGPLF